MPRTQGQASSGPGGENDSEPPESDPDANPELRQGLSQRQLSMIAIGGVIGAGLFVGSGVVIKDTGPAAFLTYTVCGLLIILVMRMLGEMAAANPSTGSFADYAGRLAVLVLLGDRGRVRSGRGREGSQLLVSRAAVAAVAVLDGADDRDELVLRFILR